MSQPPAEEGSPVAFQDKEPQISNFPIVGIGASAGGLEAFSQLLGALPGDSGMAFVVVQHLDPGHQSELANILAGHTSMAVREITQGLSVEPNHVYVIPPNALLDFKSRAFNLSSRRLQGEAPATIDHFFLSLATEQTRLSIGVVLSGMGSDGAEGLKAIKSVCGIAFAQDEDSAKYPFMPRSAVGTGIVDFVLPPAQIAQELTRISRNQFITSPSGPASEEVLPAGNQELAEIFALVSRDTGVDFSHYKEPTIRRRIGRRMVVRRLTTLGAYLAYLRMHTEEIQELFRDALINVTSFFRDPQAFSALADHLSRRIQAKQIPRDNFRAWVPGCSTGEEVYSLAICVREAFEALGARPQIQIFGTDISPGALSVARTGVYPDRIVNEMSSERLSRYFTPTDGKYQISRPIRDACIFSKHDVTHDTPFSRLHLISCRNVLIYLDSVLQKALFPAFHYALNADGLLFLGSAETLEAGSADLFSTVDSKSKLFSRRPGSTKPDRLFAWHPKASDSFTQVQVAKAVTSQSLGSRVDRVIRDRYAPDAVVINGQWQILQFRGATGFYLEPAPGEASYHLLRMARGELAYVLREAVSTAVQENVFVEKKGIKIQQGGEVREISLEVIPLDGPAEEERFYLVTFRRDVTWTSPASQENVVPPVTTDQRVIVLEQQLQAMRRHERASAEEQEAVLEEAQALNEELRSANEELQSSNEELGTTKEELQSANEELTTVNEELNTRNGQLGALNDDLSNLFAAVESPVIKVDRQLCLQRITPAAEKLGISPTDLTHPIRHLRHQFGTLPEIEQLIRDVINTLSPQTHNFQDRESHWWSLAIRPYRTTDHRIDGAVLTFTDTDVIQRALRLSETARLYGDAIIQTVRQPLVVLSPEARIERGNASFYHLFSVDPAQVSGQSVYALGGGQLNKPELHEELNRVTSNKEFFAGLELRVTFADAGTRLICLDARQILSDGEKHAILLGFEDVTDRRKQEASATETLSHAHRELDRTKEELRALANNLMNAREEEDRRIARELHDDVSQRLALLEITIETYRLNAAAENRPELTEMLAGVQRRISELSQDIRELSHRLHPSVLDMLGLPAALKSLVEDVGAIRPGPIHLHSENVPPSLPATHATNVYRIVQEALNNATKYAPAAPVNITLVATDHLLHLTIEDKGPGFNVSAIREKKGLGLVNMQERAHALGAQLHIRSQPGQGTTITLGVPIPENNDEQVPNSHSG